MSFKDNYSKQIESIRADGYIKQKILNKISKNQAKKAKMPIAYVMRAAAAMAACFAVVLTVFIINGKDAVKPKTVNDVVGNNAASYDEIYKTIEVFKPKNNIISDVVDFILGDEEESFKYKDDMVVYEYVTDGAVAPGAAKGEATATNTNDSSKDKHSETNTQVDGVAEADIVKTDGRYIYSSSAAERKIRIIKAGKEPKLVKTIEFDNPETSFMSNMYLVGDKLVLMASRADDRKLGTIVYIYDVSVPEKAEKVYECKQSGFYNTSRVIGDKLYLISNYTLNVGDAQKEEPETFVPYVECKNYDGAVRAGDVFINKNCSRAVYTVICGYDITSGKLIGSQSLLGGTYTLYCSAENIITADYAKDGKTNVARFAIKDGKVEFKATGQIDGNLLNQFSIDEHKGYFRFVTTIEKGAETKDNGVISYTFSRTNALTVLDMELKPVGGIGNIAPDERVYSVRFMGDIAYFVTFRQVDPLFSVDLKDPKNPKIIGALKIPGFSSYLFPYGEGKLLGIGQDADEKTGRTGGIKLSMFDITDPTDVNETAKLILDVNYSPALYGHKESLVDFGKNVIGFSVYGNFGSEYRIFSFKDGAFVLEQRIELGKEFDNVRGLYIGEEFYIVTDGTLYVFNMNDYSEIARISLT